MCTINWGYCLNETWNGYKYLLNKMNAELKEKDLSESNVLGAGKSTAGKVIAVHAADSGLIPSMHLIWPLSITR